MHIYQSTVDYLLQFPILNSWHEMRTILQRIASTQPRDWRLLLVACQAVGNLRKRRSLACAQISSILVDDTLDDDPCGEYRRIGSGRGSNLLQLCHCRIGSKNPHLAGFCNRGGPSLHTQFEIDSGKQIAKR